MSVLRCMNFSVVILVVYMIAIYSLLTSNLVVFFFLCNPLPWLISYLTGGYIALCPGSEGKPWHES